MGFRSTQTCMSYTGCHRRALVLAPKSASCRAAQRRPCASMASTCYERLSRQMRRRPHHGPHSWRCMSCSTSTRCTSYRCSYKVPCCLGGLLDAMPSCHVTPEAARCHCPSARCISSLGAALPPAARSALSCALWRSQGRLAFCTASSLLLRVISIAITTDSVQAYQTPPCDILQLHLVMSGSLHLHRVPGPSATRRCTHLGESLPLPRGGTAKLQGCTCTMSSSLMLDGCS